MLSVRYESLIQKPRDEVGRILAFASQESRTDDLGFIHRSSVELRLTHTVSGNPMRFEQGDVPLRLDREWQVRMKGSHQLLVAALTWPLRRVYGYRLRRDG